jgi:TfoX/Sxy family transcriptional regulator of competence genes
LRHGLLSPTGGYRDRRNAVDWEKPSPELSRILDEAAEPFAIIERRKMFGCPAFYINGNMFAGVYGQQLFLRLPPEARTLLETETTARPFEPMPGRPMTEYVAMPEAIWSDSVAMEEWMRRSVEFVGAMPPKQPKPKKSAGPKSAGPKSAGPKRAGPKTDPEESRT